LPARTKKEYINTEGKLIDMSVLPKILYKAEDNGMV
jgi:hypothetical protein